MILFLQPEKNFLLLIFTFKLYFSVGFKFGMIDGFAVKEITE